MTRVLVVDDEIDTLNLLRTILEISGYEAFTTLNSVEAITLADVERPDLILLDIMMPKLDGFTLCKMMRLHPVTANLPIVFVTAYSALDLEDRRREAGADMVLPKPIGMDMLIAAIEKASELRQSKSADSNHEHKTESHARESLEHRLGVAPVQYQVDSYFASRPRPTPPDHKPDTPPVQHPGDTHPASRPQPTPADHKPDTLPAQPPVEPQLATGPQPTPADHKPDTLPAQPPVEPQLATGPQPTPPDHKPDTPADHKPDAPPGRQPAPADHKPDNK